MCRIWAWLVSSVIGLLRKSPPPLSLSLSLSGYVSGGWFVASQRGCVVQSAILANQLSAARRVELRTKGLLSLPPFPLSLSFSFVAREATAIAMQATAKTTTAYNPRASIPPFAKTKAALGPLQPFPRPNDRPTILYSDLFGKTIVPESAPVIYEYHEIQDFSINLK